jgi:hypothetical protein
MSAPQLTMGTPQAAALQATVQKELARLEYSDDDPVMAEVRAASPPPAAAASLPKLTSRRPTPGQYITVMLANAKTKQMITDELLDLIGDGFGVYRPRSRR